MTTTFPSSTLHTLCYETNRELRTRLDDLDGWVYRHAEAIGEANFFHWNTEASITTGIVVRLYVNFNSKEQAMQFVHSEVGVEATNGSHGDQRWFVCLLTSFSIYVFYPNL